MVDWLISKMGLKSCKIDEYFLVLENRMDKLVERCDNIERKLERELKDLTLELEFYKIMLHTVANTIPDMMWAKDINGRYLYANKAIRDGLLFDKDPRGKTDVEMALAAKKVFGSHNHTFGEKCANSDAVVINKWNAGDYTEQDGRFLESGKVKGKMKYLEVFKAPLVVDGKLVGVVGTGRDMTEYVEAYREHNCNGCDKMTDIFTKYEFEE